MPTNPVHPQTAAAIDRLDLHVSEVRGVASAHAEASHINYANCNNCTCFEAEASGYGTPWDCFSA